MKSAKQHHDTPAAEKERRGDRRSTEEKWTCQREVPPQSGTRIGPRYESVECGSEHRAEDELGRVFCTRCGQIDRRSTVGNRRRARLELAQLERRIERELGDAKLRLSNLEYHVRGAHVAPENAPPWYPPPAARQGSEP